MTILRYNSGHINTSGSAANRPLNTKADKELMMSTPDYTKTCPICGKTKPTTDFYEHPDYPDGLNYNCKSCSKKASKEFHRRLALFGAKAVEPESTRLVRNLLARRGIPCVTGHKIGMPYVDLAAWACIPIEAKLSRPVQDREALTFAWRLSHKQRSGIPGLIVFVGMVSKDDLHVFIVPGDAEWMTKANGEFKMKGIKVAIDGSGKNWEGLSPFESRYDLIEEYRKRYSEQLATRTKTKDILQVIETPKPQAIEKKPSVYDLPMFKDLA
jgi:hypothetical protein